jgi:ribosomal protein S18 acetylase RimI-like enzyme
MMMMISDRRRILFSAMVVLLDVFLVLQSEFTFSNALVVTSPRWEEDCVPQRTRRTMNGAAAPETISTTHRQQVPILRLRIRSTAHKDIPMVSSILSHALLEEEEKGSAPPQQSQYAFNFKKRMEFLRTKAGVTSLLHSRMEAIATGKKLWHIVSRSSLEGLNDTEKLRYLWSSDIFRNKLEKACKLSDEPHSWKGYNFACAPEKTEQLFHKMLTAENVATGEIVGFCEVAMLSQPNHWSTVGDDGSDSVKNQAVPTIVNLVTSAEYRRRGIASSILQSASKYVELKGCSQELALYVEQHNKGALRMYERLGFQTHYDSADQLYMKANVAQRATETREAAWVI